eukprot:m.341093 g.341093  ORF g.341093 m.341093 type:complete len:586 (+) comp19804_c0_seq1:118-1875(+)
MSNMRVCGATILVMMLVAQHRAEVTITGNSKNEIVMDGNDVVFALGGDDDTSIKTVLQQISDNNNSFSKLEERINRDIEPKVNDVLPKLTTLADDLSALRDIVGDLPIKDDGSVDVNTTITTRVENILGLVQLLQSSDAYKQELLNGINTAAMSMANNGVVSMTSWTGVEQGVTTTNDGSNITVHARDAIPDASVEYVCSFNDNSGKSIGVTSGVALSPYILKCPTPVLNNPKTMKFNILLVKIEEKRGGLTGNTMFKGTKTTQTVAMSAAGPSIEFDQAFYEWSSDVTQLKVGVTIDDPDHNTNSLKVTLSSPDISKSDITDTFDGRTGAKTITISSRPSTDTYIIMTVEDDHTTATANVSISLKCSALTPTLDYLVQDCTGTRQCTVRCKKGFTSIAKNVAPGNAKAVSTATIYYPDTNGPNKLFEGHDRTKLNPVNRFVAKCLGTCYIMIDLGRSFKIDAIAGWNGWNNIVDTPLAPHRFQAWRTDSNNKYSGTVPPNSDLQMRDMMLYNDGWNAIQNAASGQVTNFQHTFPSMNVQFIRMEINSLPQNDIIRLFELQFWENGLERGVKCQNGDWEDFQCPS